MKTLTKEYSVSEVAQAMDKPESTIRSWIYSGKLDSIKRIGRRYIKQDALLKFLQENNVPIPVELSENK